MIQYQIKYFRPHEFTCPCCGKGNMAKYTVIALDVLRRAWGGPIQVNSGWRCPAHNREVGGSNTSRHLIGCAADVKPAEVAKDELDMFFQIAFSIWNQPGWELIKYPTFLHIAAPRAEASSIWDGDGIVRL